MSASSLDEQPLVMVRESLVDIPDYALPPGYSVRWYQPGDEHKWVAIQSLCYPPEAISLALFRKEFADNREALQSRQCYLLDGSRQPIGTATAWFDDIYQTHSYGRIHWVAIVPGHQGLGLSKPLMTIVCDRLKALGHTKAYLTTSATRLIAVRLYRKFGFVEKLADTGVLADDNR